MDSPHRKITSQLLRSMSTVRGDDEIAILIRFVPKRRVLRHAHLRSGVRESYHYRLAPFTHAHATRSAILELEKDDDIVRIYQDSPVHAILAEAPIQVGVPYVWAGGYTGAGVSIAIVDTGIDADHPDLAGRIAAMIDYTGDGEDDTNGHGTHCAGIAAGSGSASGGAYCGIAPGATLYSARVLDSGGSGMMSDVMAGVDWAVQQGVQIISMSLGGSSPNSGEDPLVEICDAAVEAGVMVCAAAGNNGPDASTIGSPGVAESVLTIGAVDREDGIASFSSRGPTSDGRVKPDVMMPGTNIIAARASGTSLGTIVNDYYTKLSGTSMACPMAAGLCALALEARPTLTPAALKQAIMSTALDLGEDANAQGSGRCDAQALFASLGIELPDEPVATPEPTEPDEDEPEEDDEPTTETPTTNAGCLLSLMQVLTQLIKH